MNEAVRLYLLSISGSYDERYGLRVQGVNFELLVLSCLLRKLERELGSKVLTARWSYEA